MYTIYVAPLANVINKHSINYHCYADDTLIYIQCANNTTAVHEAITRIQDCITDVSKWMSRNALKINEDKTKFIIFSAKHYTYDRMSIQIGTNTMQHNNNVKILGVTLEAHMPLEKQISNTCRTSYMQIRRISSIRRYLTVDAVKTLVQATVTLRLDYCNSIYTNLRMKSIHRLKITQNSDARLISRTPRHEHITPVLVQLHWLPITKIYQFNISTMTYKASHHNEPPYICDTLNWYQPARTLRSASTTSLVPNRNRTI